MGRKPANGYCLEPGCLNQQVPNYCRAHGGVTPSPKAPRDLRREVRERAVERFLRAQERRCAICGVHDSAERLVLDHDHRCCKDGCERCWRGLLCGKCNTGIGFLQDQPDIIYAAARYVDER